MEQTLTRTELNLQTLYQEHLPSVYRVAYSYMHNSYDSEDAAQEAFLRLARSFCFSVFGLRGNSRMHTGPAWTANVNREFS